MSVNTFYNQPENIVIGGDKNTIYNYTKRNEQEFLKKSLKVNSNGNQPDYRRMYKLDNKEEEIKLNRVSNEYSKNLINARVKAKLTRKQLAQQLNEKESTITDYETGKAIKDNKIMNKLNKFIEKNK
jgi:ribosome-binding protein aMBF1 (putative translation factor)